MLATTTQEGTYQITVVEGRNLRDKEFGKKNDLFVEIWSDEHDRVRTKPVHEIENPVWNETFMFNLHHGCKNLNIAVHDEDATKNEIIGHGKIHLADIAKNGNLDEWVKLPRMLGLSSNGEIHIRAEYQDKMSNPHQHTKQSSVSPSHAPLDTIEDAETRKMSMKNESNLQQNPDTRTHHRTFGKEEISADHSRNVDKMKGDSQHMGDHSLFENYMDNIPSMGSLHVTITEGKNLCDQDMTARKECFVEMWVDDGRKYHTRSILNSGNPIWNQDFNIPITKNSRILHVRICDNDASEGNQTEGTAQIPIGNVMTMEAYDSWERLPRKMGMSSGELHIVARCQMHSVPTNPALHPDIESVYSNHGARNVDSHHNRDGRKHPDSLKVTVVKAKNLRDKDFSGKNDCYVELWIDRGYTQKTFVAPNTDNPVWYQTFMFPMNTDNQVLHMRVLDSDVGHDDKIGEITLDLSELSVNNKKVDKYFSIPKMEGFSSNGELHVKIKMKTHSMYSEQNGRIPHHEGSLGADQKHHLERTSMNEEKRRSSLMTGESRRMNENRPQMSTTAQNPMHHERNLTNEYLQGSQSANSMTGSEMNRGDESLHKQHNLQDNEYREHGMSGRVDDSSENFHDAKEF